MTEFFYKNYFSSISKGLNNPEYYIKSKINLPNHFFERVKNLLLEINL